MDEQTPNNLKDLLRERAEADVKIERLLNGEKVGKKRGFWTWGLCERLQERSWELRQKNPAQMVVLARHAVEAAQKVAPRLYGIQQVWDLRARAWGGLANAYRISDQLPLAEEAFERAFEARRKGTGSPLLQARLAELSASLLCDQRHFPTAFQLLDFAHQTYSKHDAPHEAGRVLIQKGLQTGWSGDPEDGIFLIARGLQRIDRDRDPKLVFQSLHNILLFRVELGKFKSARRQIWDMRPLYEYHDDQILKVKLRGIEGKVFLGLRETDRAIAAFQQAREGFLSVGLEYDAALVSFELAEVWVQQGKQKDVFQLLQEMVEIFRERYVERETVAALILLRDSAKANELSLDTLEMIGGLFHAYKKRPKSGPDVVEAD